MNVSLKEARCRKDMTQKELAEFLGISQPILSQYETGKRVPNLVISRRIAAALDISLDLLRFGIDKEK